jgi:integrase
MRPGTVSSSTARASPHIAIEVQHMASKNSKSKRDRVWVRKNKDGSISYKGVVQIRPFDRVSKAFPVYSQAKDWAATQVEMLRKKKKQGGELRTDIMKLTLKEFLELYLDDPKTQKLETLDDVKRLCGWWVNRFGAEKIIEIGPLKLHEARALLYKGRAEGTVNRYLGALRSAWSWGKSCGVIAREAMEWPEKNLFLPEPDARVRFLDDDELTALLTVAEKHSAWMYAAVVSAIGSGLRQGELLRLTWKEIDLAKGTLVVFKAKNKKKRLVHVPMPCIDALKKARMVGPERVFVRADGGPIDKSRLRVAWLKVRGDAKLENFRWHDLRHCCASYLAQAGSSLPEIGHVLGHSSPIVTAKYAHLVAGKPVTGSAALAAKLAAKL